ncbi:Reverse gyrase [Desulfurobacterium thermolithotrophum DSM 11699]|uniref:Reverse gyrase n=1 Tax=Desulfurobacterium thermolithotrophum (strain DSM 11699 / BSA) TaxID=868864 RepID=F0S2F6_DESTD|nr:reverse gyrase [Desulfurobacterium thermolithotrophum]ADY73028.1 Reverse gyrase [Desulfurobacterium thermolithotrophum DSM 11699]
MKLAEFHRMCPNCGGIISDERLKAGLPCEKCLPKELFYTNRKEICNALGNKLQDFKKICLLDEFTENYVKFFKEKTGFTPWTLQVMWARRVALSKSFTMIAPTGVGKTTWGLVTSAYLSGKVYILVPTKLLVLQTVEKLSKLTNKKIVAYTGKKSEKGTIQSGNFEILVTTTNFLYRNFEIIPKPFDFVFVDDVDSLLKSAKNVDKVIRLLGFTEEDISIAEKVLELKSLVAKFGEKVDRKLIEKLKKLENFLEKRKSEIKNVLVVSSATSQPKSKRVKLFRELLGFEVGKSATALRNVEDVLIYTDKDYLEETVKIIKKYGKGVFVFISEDLGKDYVEEVVNFLNKKGISTVSYENFSSENQGNFIDGKIQAVVGIASYRNPLARGIDLPQAVRYAVFLGVPKLEFNLKLSLAPVKLFGILLVLRELIEDKTKVMSYLSYLKKYLSLKKELLDKYPKVKEKLEEIKGFLESYLSNKEFLEKVRASEDISLKEKNGELFVVVGDATGYVQASGRTSRMFAGGLTKGVSLMLVDDLKALNSLKKRLSIFLEDLNFKVLDYDKGKELAEKFGFELIDEEKLNKIFKTVDEDRKRVKEILEGKIKAETKNLVNTALIVVESPNKARTIANFFGKPVRRKVLDIDVYEINIGDRLLLLTASKGHVFDLTVRDGLWGVKEEESSYIPVYDTIKYCTKCFEQTTEPFCSKCSGKPDVDKITVVRALREVGLEIDEVYIASDPDTEGEKIGWDIGTVIKPFQKKVRRMEFHEVTKWAFMEALKTPKEIDENLVKAQIVRRIADRWVGFALSQHLWKVFKKHWLSAGRVQTPVLGWVIKRYEESKEKKGIIVVETKAGSFRFEFDNLEEFQKIAIDKVEIKVKEKSIFEKNSLPPFNTGELLKEASNNLGISAEETMNIAQALFESGFITYHRTDSTRVSTAGMGVAKEYISQKFGAEFIKLRSWGDGGAHECIRPTRPLDAESLKALVLVSGSSSKMTKNHFRIYDLIFKRFMASQMIPTKVEKCKLLVKLLPVEKEEEEERIAKIVKNGWNLIQPLNLEPLSVELKKEKTYYFEIISYVKKKVPKVFPYTQGELIEEMRKKEIGRPSTYAKIVQTLLDRKYIIEKGKFLYPTKLGIEVYNYLSEKFPDYTSEEFTRELENIMDKVERGEEDYQKVIENLKPILEIRYS